LALEAATLGFSVLLVALFDGETFRVPATNRGPGSARGIPNAGSTLFLLGAVALALRVIDPLYDAKEFGLRSIATPAAWLELLAVLPFGAATEEMIFRSCQKRLRELLGSAPAIVAIALCFALYHWAPGSPLDRHAIEMLIATFIGGLAFAVAYERTGGLLLLVSIHLAYNFLAVAQTWMHLVHDIVSEAGLFSFWLTLAGALAWSGRLSRGGFDAPSAEVASPQSRAPATSRLFAWIFALGFGCVLPLLLAWIRIALRF